jgi:hypothetical protein
MPGEDFLVSLAYSLQICFFDKRNLRRKRKFSLAYIQIKVVSQQATIYKVISETSFENIDEKHVPYSPTTYEQVSQGNYSNQF